jgi:hypothetical protein
MRSKPTSHAGGADGEILLEGPGQAAKARPVYLFLRTRWSSRPYVVWHAPGDLLTANRLTLTA